MVCAGERKEIGEYQRPDGEKRAEVTGPLQEEPLVTDAGECAGQQNDEQIAAQAAGSMRYETAAGGAGAPEALLLVQRNPKSR